MSNQFGIEAIEIYFPKTFVDQVEFGNILNYLRKIQ